MGHRRITTPAGALLFACLALPGYRECGHAVAMASDPLLAALCGFGLIAAAVSLVGAGARHERKLAIVLAVGASVTAILLGLEWAARNHAYAGISLGTMIAAGLVTGLVLWEREVRGHGAAVQRVLPSLLPLMSAALAMTAVLSDWTPAQIAPRCTLVNHPVRRLGLT